MNRKKAPRLKKQKYKQMNRTKDVTLILVLGTFLSMGIFSSFGLPISTLKKQTASAVTAISKNEISYFDSLQLEAKAVYVWDIKNDKVLFEKNSTLQLPLASLNKIMTAIVALEGTKETVVIDSSDIQATGDSGLKKGERFEKKEIIKLMLTSSSNDAASAVASNYEKVSDSVDSKQAFLEAMNKKAEELDLKQTYYLNESGLDLTGAISGGHGSAKDIAKLLYYGVTHYFDIFSATAEVSEKISSEEKSHLVKNTNTIVETFPGILASKTGFTEMAQGNLAVILNLGLDRPVAVVVLGSTYDGRFEDTKKLISAVVKTIGEEK